MKKDQINLILNELLEKTKFTKQKIILPTECKIPLSEIKHYDIFIFKELQETIIAFESSKSTYTNKINNDYYPVLKIIDDYVIFYIHIIKQFQKEHNK